MQIFPPTLQLASLKFALEINSINDLFIYLFFKELPYWQQAVLSHLVAEANSQSITNATITHSITEVIMTTWSVPSPGLWLCSRPFTNIKWGRGWSRHYMDNLHENKY